MSRPMKYSGYSWIGDIPINWEVRAVKHYYKMQTGFTPDTKNESYYDDEDGFDWVAIGDLTGAKFIPTSTKSHVSSLYLQENRQPIVPKGSLLYSFKLSVGQVAFADRDVYTNEAIASFINSDDICLEFLFYSSSMIVENANENIYGAKLLNQDLIRNAMIVYPPVEEQRKIATFLDSQCAHIDTVIEKTKASIEEYKKLKQTVITQAVTKGVRNDRTMKDSAISWLKQIPEEWDEIKGKHLFAETKEYSEYGEEELLTVSHITGVTPRSEKNVNMFMSESLVGYKKCHIGDIAANTMWMWQGAIGVSKHEGVISPSYNTYRQRQDDYDLDYLEYLLRIPPLVATYGAHSTGITASRLRLYPDQFFSIEFPIPSKEEQREIANYLNAKIPEMDCLIQKKEQILAELDEYKRSLIYEYVTGKKEVL